MSARTAAADARLERARTIADAVLYEGYVLFPYHAAATKNRYRWQFGVLVPAPQAALDDTERATVRSQVLVTGTPATSVEVVVRFLHPLRRQVERFDDRDGFVPVDTLELDGELHTTWEEGREHERRFEAHPFAGSEARTHRISLAGSTDVEQLHDTTGQLVGRIRRTTEPVELEVTVAATTLDARVIRLTSEVTNATDWVQPSAERAEVVRHAVAGLHLLLTTDAGHFASAIDPPGWAAAWAGTCENVGTYPVLVADPTDEPADDVVLSAPIILYDHPQVDDQSPGDAYDATEIHELLQLCTTALSEDEKRAARATDLRAASVIDQADHLPPELIERLHGAVRSLGPRESGPAADLARRASQGPRSPLPGPSAEVGGTRLNEPAADHPLTEELAAFLGAGDDPISSVRLGDTELHVGDRVRLEPGRRADAQDLFVTGRVGIVGRIVETLEGEIQVGVTVEGDPAAEMHEWYGRFLYFHLDEIAVLAADRESEVR